MENNKKIQKKQKKIEINCEIEENEIKYTNI